jgi:hypothetical protein
MYFTKPAFSIALLLSLLMPCVLPAQSLLPGEKQTIEALIERVGTLTDAQFIRNGASYSADEAATFLRRKWQANSRDVKTARDFIAKVASFSGTSGKPYLIRFNDGKEMKSNEFLLAELKRIENTRTNRYSPAH